MRDPVIITGTPRSGIWLTAGAFEVAGGFSGLLDKSGTNVTGELENIGIRDRLERPLLQGLGYEPRGLGLIPATDEIEKLSDRMKTLWRQLVDDVFIKQNCPDNAVRFISSQVACLLWPLWHAAFPEAKWIVVRRDERDIIASCHDTGYVQFYREPGDKSRRVRSDKELTELINGYKLRFQQMNQASLDLIEYWPQQLYDGNLAGLRNLLECHGLSWRPEVAEFVRPFQWKHGTLEIEGVDNGTCN